MTLLCPQVLVDIGYEMLMTQGTDLIDGIIRSSPLYSSAAGTTNKAAADAAERINVKQVSCTTHALLWPAVRCPTLTHLLCYVK